MPAAAWPHAVPEGAFTRPQCVLASPWLSTPKSSATQQRLWLKSSSRSWPSAPCVSCEPQVAFKSEPRSFLTGSEGLDGWDFFVSLLQWPFKRCPFPHLSIALPQDCLSSLHGMFRVRRCLRRGPSCDLSLCSCPPCFCLVASCTARQARPPAGSRSAAVRGTMYV